MREKNIAFGIVCFFIGVLLSIVTVFFTGCKTQAEIEYKDSEVKQGSKPMIYQHDSQIFVYK